MIGVVLDKVCARKETSVCLAGKKKCVFVDMQATPYALIFFNFVLKSIGV